MTQVIEMINETMEEIRLMLVEKNRAYGNSALDPVRIFSKADPIEQLKVRIDDKISRVQKGHELAGESVIDDMIGYLVLLKIARRIEDALAAERLGGNQFQPQAAPQHNPASLYPAGYAPGFAQQPQNHGNIYAEPQHQADTLENLADGLDRWYADQARSMPA